ncbi:MULTISPECIES: hypothetical protein [Pseudarthrobacter]|uniref:hypothetical protein n=1 Tax=Pseudarthrobacter TaxID=1742993 RepID=UPI0013DC033E|nr:MULTISPECIES: hypothetical protein [Pseudarthrobacter]MDQ0000662.1 hypothetical protein [Pseudarthrobacter sulfonivorans]
MSHNANGYGAAGVPGTGVNDHAWEREHRHPTRGQLRAIGYRRRDAETKLEQHQLEARQRAGGELLDPAD